MATTLMINGCRSNSAASAGPRTARGPVVSSADAESGLREIHGLGLGEELASRLALLARMRAGALCAAKGDMGLGAGGFAVDMDDADLGLPSERHRAAEVMGED